MLAIPNDLKHHPIADLFPMMSEEAFEALKADIKAHGQHEPIITFQETVLDGRNRLRACRELGIEPHLQEWDGHGGTPLDFTISKNLQRRHLTESQRAMIGARITNLKRGQDPEDMKKKTNTGIPVFSETPFEPVTIAQAAGRLNVSPDSIGRARAVLGHCAPDVIKAVDDGRLKVHAAHKSIKNMTVAKKIRKVAGRTQKQAERIERMQSRAAIWAHVKTALLELTSLPRASDVVPIIAEMDKNQIVKAKLPGALAWLQEFAKCQS